MLTKDAVGCCFVVLNLTQIDPSTGYLYAFIYLAIDKYVFYFKWLVTR